MFRERRDEGWPRVCHIPGILSWEPPLGLNKNQLVFPLNPTQSIGNLDEDMACRESCSALQKRSLEAL